MDTYGIDPGFLEFLLKLENKKNGEPLIYWQSGIDFLDVFIGEGDCREYAIGGLVCPHIDILVKRHPSDDEDEFAGFEMWGGIQSLLHYHYKKILGDNFTEFAIRHNTLMHEYHASELLDLWLKQFPEMSKEIVRIKKALANQNPSIHIPFQL